MRSGDFLVWSAVSLALVFAPAPARANMAVNGSFEVPAITSNSFCFSYTPPISPACPAVPAWTGDFYLVNGNSGGGIGGTPIPPIPDGAQYIMIQADNHVTQSITIPAAGIYTLSWFDAGRSAFSGTDTYNVLFGGILQNTFSTAPTQPWTPHTLPIATSAGTFDLSFVGTLSFSFGDNSFFLDNVVLDAPPGTTPEPGTILMAMGAFAIFAAVRQRKS